MSRIAPFAAADVPAVAALHARAFPGAAWSSPAAREAYFRQALLENPWVDPRLPSLVARDGEEAIGFFGVLPRRMRLGGRALRVAVGCQFMLDPRARDRLAAIELMRAFLGGAQDLAVADGANDASRSLWLACGGAASALQEIEWQLLLRPAQALWRRGARRSRVLAALGAPLAALADAAAARLVAAGRADGLRCEPLDARSLAAAFDELRGGYALAPAYDAASLEWLLAQAAAKTRHGELGGALVREGGATLGWYLCYFNLGTSQVLQLAARRGRLRAVLGCLAREARARGALALEGRMEPALAAELAGTGRLLQKRGAAVLLHARDPQVLLPFLRGDAFFSRLDGEWWMRFAGDLEGGALQRTCPRPASAGPIGSRGTVEGRRSAAYAPDRT